MKPLRKFVRWAHLWLGLIAGAFICLMGFSGGMVALRPQIAMLLAPASPSPANCQAAPDWNRAAEEISAVTGTEINRIYGFEGGSNGDPRYHIRMATDSPIIFKHVIYDACAAKVLGTIDFGWMDWTVDLHHNLLSGRAGRQWAGFIGIAMLISALSGMLVWLMAKPDLSKVFRVEFRWTQRTPREMHRALGLLTAAFLTLEALTGLWVSFPQTMRSALMLVAPAPETVRAPRPRSTEAAPLSKARLGDMMAAAHATIPDGFIREIRMPEGNGNVQVRMWRPDDFRSLGNNVVFLSGATAQVLAVDRYVERSSSSRLTQAIVALHYDEWGGLPLRLACGLAGLITPLLFVSGLFIWWLSLRRRKRGVLAEGVAPQEVSRVR